jgi:hypothetical protein
MKLGKPLRLYSVALGALALLIFVPLALAQSCSLCYTQAASSGSRMIEALRSGILVLIVPPTLMWLVVFAILYAKRNQHKHVGGAGRSASDW